MITGRRWPFARASLPGLLALLAGCTLFASKSDYLDYRAVQVARDEESELLAMQRYVATHPDGSWYDEISRERQARDRSVFEAGRSDRKGLELYLRAFPDGQFTAQAQSRLAAVAVIEQRKREENERAQRLAEERKQRDEELRRTWVTRFFAYWMKTLIGLDNWGSPIEQVARGNPEFSQAFGRPPRPRCSADECVKYYESSYAVPVPGGTRIERSMRLWLRLGLQKGKLERAELLLPASGFSRWQEVEERRPSVDGDAEARAKAMEWALARVTPLLAPQPGQKLEPIANYALGALPKLEFASTGEQTDTTAETPAAPPNQIQGSAPAQQPTVEELVQPQPKEAAPDLEMDALQIDRQGRAQPAAPGAQAPAPAAGSGELVFEPLAVPQSSGAAPQAPAPAAGQPPPPAAPSAAPAPAAPQQPMVRAYKLGSLRIVVFAAPASDPSGVDVVIIERIASARWPKRPAGASKPAAAAAPPPSAPAPGAPAR